MHAGAASERRIWDDAETLPRERLKRSSYAGMRTGPLDELTLECEPAVTGTDGEVVRAQLARLLQDRTGLRITVALMRPGSIPRSEGKAVGVPDRRPAAAGMPSSGKE